MRVHACGRKNKPNAADGGTKFEEKPTKQQKKKRKTRRGKKQRPEREKLNENYYI